MEKISSQEAGLKLEVGKSYRRRDGEIEDIDQYEEGLRYPFISCSGKSFTESGKYLGKEALQDLIEEVVDEPRANTSKCNIMAEATEIAERHPSKDARAFANSVLSFLDEESSSVDERASYPKHYASQAIELLLSAIDGHRGRDQQAIASEIVRWGAILLKKNTDYGSSVWRSPSLAPDSSIDMAIRVRMSDKISRLQTLMSSNAGSQVNESIDDTIFDLGGYCLLLLANPERGRP